jgi:hypothetical protein
VVDRAQVQVDGFESAEGELDAREALIGAYRRRPRFPGPKTLSSRLVRMT